MEMSQIELQIRPSDSVTEIEENDGLVLVDLRQGLCFTVNAVGGRIWRMMKMNQPLALIIETIVADFSVPKERVSCEVMAFIHRLNEEGLLAHEVYDCVDSPAPAGS
jgi:Coenzyme PQQ synthesis protein D (PqqD)